MQQKLDRSLGMYSAITISVGTMIGSAIFVLAGTSYATAGPSASLAIFLAGIAAIFTGLSFAELVTIIPKAGGGYAYVREATNNSVIGFICGWGFWLGYAMSCGLFALGFGNFLNYFFPFIPQMVGAYGLVVYVVFTNIRGVKSSGKLQDIITTGLILLLLGYIFYGVFHMDLDNQVPFMTHGFNGMFNAMGFLYMTYIGYGLITTASEEVINPEKTIPKAIMISLAFVIFIKTATFFIGSGIIHWEQLLPTVTSTPLTDTAVKMAGRLGGYLFAFAGILATLSSINTAVMASSRTSFALARDQRFPSIFKMLNPGTKTPVFSIVVTGVIVVIAVSIRDLEHISTVTSIFSLTGYSLVNVALMIFRKREPSLKRAFKAPLYPLTPILGIGLNVFLIYQLAMSDLVALSIAMLIILIGLIYFYLAIPKLKSAPKGFSTLEVPFANSKEIPNVKGQQKIYVPVSNPQTREQLLNFAKNIAITEADTVVVPIHIVNIPNILSVGIDTAMSGSKELEARHEAILGRFDTYEKEIGKVFKPLIVHSRDVAHGIISSIDKKQSNQNPFLLMGWHSSGLAHNMHGGMVAKMLDKAPADVGILKEKNLKEVKKILFPYGGGRYSQLTVPIVKRIAKAYDAEVTVIKVVDDITGKEEKTQQIKEALGNTLGADVKIQVIEGNLTHKLIELSKAYDLLVIGASLDWGLKEYITGLRSDKIVEEADCSTLVIKSYGTVLQRNGLRKYLHNIKRLLQKN